MMMAAMMFISSFISFSKDSNLLSGTMAVATSSLSQYLVSLASFKAISSLWMKSAVLCAALDSSTFAPIEVADRISCFDISLAPPDFLFKKLQSLTMRTEN